MEIHKLFMTFVLIKIIMIILALFLLLLALFLINFYRDPKRRIPNGNNVVSPADGKVIGILKIKQDKTRIKKGYIGKIETLTKDIAKECYVVSIFMSLIDVHVNRAPITGKIISIKPEKGRFYAAYDLKKSLMNEKNEIVMQNKELGKIKVIQIAGFAARRIICRVKQNEKVNKGQRIGMIVLGSQVTLILPVKKTILRVREGMKVKGGSSIIADIK